MRATSLLLCAAGAASLLACAGPTAPRLPSPAAVDTTPPPIAREMRGLWIATVANIDWPSKNDLTADQQRAELADLLDRAAANGFNAVMFQVRPAGDAVYASSLEPWASLLTGTQGTDPGYDPLAFAVAQAHARGLELHAWINPFRAGNVRDSTAFAPTHAFVAHRDLIRVYGTQLWSDPGEPEVQSHAISVVRDIVQRYDIDGVHADDYFYPYQESDSAGHIIDFPDSGSYARSSSTLARDDWRRANIDQFIERMYREVHELKPAVKVGISPFGIWRPGNPPSVAGLDAYATIYADSRKWLQSGSVDYLAPQLYWAISAPQQSFPELLDWWIAQNSLGRHVWPGLAAYRINNGTAKAFAPNEIVDQITLTRARPGSTGHILYNTTSVMKRDSGSIVARIAPLYRQRALVPASPWLRAAPLATPSIAVSGRVLEISPAGESPRWWYVRALTRDGWTSLVAFGDQRIITLELPPSRVLVNPVDRAGNAGQVTEWRR